MSFEGVQFRKGAYGLNRANASTDAVMALVVFSPDEADASFNEATKTIQARDLDALGFDDAHEANNTILLRHHVEEFYKYAPLGTLILVPTDKATAAAFFASAEAKAIFRTESDVKRIGYVYNDNVLDLDLEAEINAVQLFVNDLAADHILIDGVYLEARNIGANAANLRLLSAPNVTPVIAQDPAIAAIDPSYANYAAIGAALGMRAARKVNENLGSVDIDNKPDAQKGEISFPLTVALTKRWLTAALSDGTPVTTLSNAERKQLTDYGYVYAGSFQGFSGFYFNGEPTCVELASDYSTGENNGVWNKAARCVRVALLPKVRGWFKRNAETGELSVTAITNLENLAKKPLNEMEKAEEISGSNVRIPTGQNPNDQTPLQAYVSVTLGAIIHEFVVDLSLN
ncbi:MAG: DUF2586 family protein [Leeuwenhoekiella sp.]